VTDYLARGEEVLHVVAALHETMLYKKQHLSS